MTKEIEKYIEYLRYEKNYSSHTEISYSTDLGQFHDFLKKESEIDSWKQVDADLARRWMVELMDEGMSASSVNRKLSSVKSFFRYLLRKGEIRIDKISTLVGPKMPKPVPSFVSDLDMATILDAHSEEVDNDSFPSVRDKAIMELFYVTGMRRAELIGLTDVDVDLSQSTILVTGKRNKQRLIPISQNTVNVLDSYLILRNRDVENITNSFFVREDGKPLYPMLVHRLVTKQLDSVATLSKKSPHVLRHSFATAMLNNGADINAIKELLGHASLAATEIYTHTSLEELKEVYNNAHPRA